MRLLVNGERADQTNLNRPHRDMGLVRRANDIVNYDVKNSDISFVPENDQLKLESKQIQVNGITIDVPEIYFDIPNPDGYYFANSNVIQQNVEKASVVDLGPGKFFESLGKIDQPNDPNTFNTALAQFGDWLIIGAQGVVNVYRKDGSQIGYSHHSTLTPPAGSSTYWGTAVSIYNDILLIGDPGFDMVTPVATTNLGKFDLYLLTNDEFVNNSTFYPDAFTANSYYGMEVCIFENVVAVSKASEIFIYDLNTSNYTLTLRDTVSGPAWNVFGNMGLALGENVLFTSDKYAETGAIDGRVWAYNWNGSSYILSDTIENINSTGIGSDISFYNNVLIVGHWGWDSTAGNNHGAVLAYSWDGTSLTQTGFFTAVDIIDSDAFGGAVSIYENNVVVLSRYDVHFFESYNGYAIPKTDLTSGTVISETNSYLSTYPGKEAIVFLESWFEKIDEGKAYDGGFIQGPGTVGSPVINSYVNMTDVGNHLVADVEEFDNLDESSRLAISQSSIIINIGTDLYQLRFRFRIEYGVRSTTLEDVFVQGQESTPTTNKFIIEDAKYVSQDRQVMAKEILRIQL